LATFSKIYAPAAKRHGGEEAVAETMPRVLSGSELRGISDDRWLSAMSLTIMRAGFSWKVVENKWPGFEVAFDGFSPHTIAMYSDDDLARLVSDTSIIRNGQKIRAIQENAIFLTDVIREHGSVGKFFAEWPHEDFTGLWLLLQKKGSRLGGKSAAYFLREMGWDTPVLSKDVAGALVREGVVDKAPTSKTALGKVQVAFNDWQEESGLPYSHMSRILALSVG
jgi:3-methyladenine DNA glycosylase Tag